VPDFARHYKIGTGAYVGKKFLSHFIAEILKSAASSGLGKFKDKMTRKNEQGKTGENPFKSLAPDFEHDNDSAPIASERLTVSDVASILGSVQKVKKKGFKKLLKKSNK